MIRLHGILTKQEDHEFYNVLTTILNHSEIKEQIKKNLITKYDSEKNWYFKKINIFKEIIQRITNLEEKIVTAKEKETR